MNWDRLEPPTPCTSPDGHGMLDILLAESSVPLDCYCQSCGQRGCIVVFADDTP